MADSHSATVSGPEDATLALPPDDRNIALIDARTTLLGTAIGVALFIGAVVVFIL
jgi:hypothetical protein